MNNTATRFATLSPWAARATLAALLLLILYGLTTNYQLLIDVPDIPTEKSDVALYQAIVARIRGGESFYVATGDELRTRGYALKPFVNWRLPTTAWLIAALPEGRAVMLQRICAVAVAGLWAVAFWRAKLGAIRFGVGLLLLFTALAITTADIIVYAHEVWAALFIAASLALYSPRRWLPSVMLGLLAMLFRELALAYCGAMLLAALIERRKNEAIGWLAVIGMFAAVLAVHASVALSYTLETDRAKSWLAGGGWGFVLSTAQWNMVMTFAPYWFPAIIVPLTLLGMVAWRHWLGLRLTLAVAGFFVAFMIVGNSNNIYWGMIYAPLLPLGLLFTPIALRDLWRAAFRRAAVVKELPQRA